MPVEVSPLFRRDILRPRVREFVPPERARTAREKVQRWAGFFSKPEGLTYKETEILPDWLTDVFQDLLGYTGPSTLAAAERHTIKREKLVEVDGKFADAVLGDFRTDAFRPVIAVEGKGPLDPLDRPYAGRKMSAVDQAYRYAINLPCDWIVVTSMREVRLYYKGANQRTYERWLLADLAGDEQELKRFVFVLGAERVVPTMGRSHLYDLLEASVQAGEDVTQGYYAEYAKIRRDVLGGLTGANPDVAPAAVLSATQRLLDRVLFVAFAEDRGLLPPESLAKAFQHRDPYNPRPTWENFKGLFRAIDHGSATLGIPHYNGGLFANHATLDHQLQVPDAACERLKRLGDFNYSPPDREPADPEDDAPIVDVEILGHIFEQSIEDLEAIRAELEGSEATRKTSRRKREGAFYTPRTVTGYIVAQALAPVLAERSEQLRQAHHAEATGTQPRALVDPAAYDLAKLNAPQREALIRFWEAWLEELAKVRVLDPACGSGAFLIEAFDQLHAAYADATERLADLRQTGDWWLFDPDRTILQQNLFGLDLNEEAVEIARLSIWIKTAQRGKVLADLDHNIRVGNSVVADATLDARAFDWHSAFPEVFAQGGFDVVIGNPPYVRADHLVPFKGYFASRYRTFHGSADLYVYFFEQGLRVLRPGGYLSFIVTNKWLKAEYAEPLRQYLAECVWVEHVVDMGHARQVFPDADVFPSIVLLRAPMANSDPPATLASVIPREGLELDRLAEQVREYSFVVERQALTSEPWLLDSPHAKALMAKVERAGESLAEYLGSEPLRGVMTGYNDAFLLSGAERDALVTSDPATADLFRPYVRGQDIERWVAEWGGRWLLTLRSSSDHPWPWRDAGDSAEAVFAQTYPALHGHMKAHEDRLRRRTDQGRYWWELRACSYYDLFERPKILYQEIQYYPAYAFDGRGLYTNNKGFFLPTDDLYLLGVLNSPLMWWHNWRFLAHMKDDALTPAAVRLRQLPIARPTDTVRERVVQAVGELIDVTSRQRDHVRQLHDWLRVEFGIEKPGAKLSAPEELDFDTFITEVKARRSARGTVTSAELRRLRDEYGLAMPLLQQALQQAADLERSVAAAVNEAYGLAEEDVGLLWRTAPPRMPTGHVGAVHQVAAT